MATEMFIITVIALVVGWFFLPWWGLLILLSALFLWWLYSFNPRYSLGGYSFLAPTKENLIALTFSGGTAETLEQTLAWLDGANIPAMFFVYGKVAQENPTVIGSIFNKGHLIGMHGFESKEDWFSKRFASEDIYKSIHRTQESLSLAIPHFHTTLFRPYKGQRMIFNPWRLKHNFGYHVVLWSFELGKNALQKITSRMIIHVPLDKMSGEKLLSRLNTLKQYSESKELRFVQIEV